MKKAWFAAILLALGAAGAAMGATVTYRKETTGATTLTIPVVKGVNKAANEAVNAALASMVREEVKALADDVEAKELVIRGKAELLEGALLSFSFEGMVYFQGAAHPSSDRLGATFDALSGKKISLEELFLPGTNWQEILDAWLFQVIDQQVAGEEIMVFDDDYPYLSEYADQFFLRPGELVFFWTDTQFTPHASGQPEFVVPRFVVEHLLRPEYAF